MKKINKILLALTLIIICVITFLTLAPSWVIAPIRRHIHIKTGHIIAYAVFSFIFIATLDQFISKNIVKKITLTILYSSLLGTFLEVLQLFTSTREGDPKDILINLKGIIIGILLYLIIRKLVHFEVQETCTK